MKPRPDTAGVLAPPPLIHLGFFLPGWGIERLVPWPLIDIAWGRPLAIALAILALLLGVWGAWSLHRAHTAIEPWKPTTALVERGPYRYTRNPLYVALTLLYLAGAFRLGSLWPFLLLPLSLVTLHFGVVRREERYLAGKFGATYDEYRRRVPRWAGLRRTRATGLPRQ